MRLPCLLGSVIAIVLVGTPAIGRAQRAGDPRAPTEEDRRLSALLLDRSAVAYRLGRYDEAVAMLQDAYVLGQEPILLYNLGRAYEGGGDAQHAIEAYRRYLETATSPLHEDAIRETIARLEQRIADERRAAEQAAAEQAAPEQAAPEQARIEETPRREPVEQLPAEPEPRGPPTHPPREQGELMPWAWTIAGVGAAGIAAGAVLGGLALDRADEAAAAPTQVDAVGTLSEARDLATGANIAFAAGGIVAAAGIVWGIVEMVHGTGTERPATIEVAPTAGGAALRGTF